MEDANKTRQISKSEIIAYQLAESDAGEQVSRLREHLQQTEIMRDWLTRRKDSENNG